MLARPASQRLAAWIMAALLALVVGEPLRMHECPVHSRMAASHETAPAADHEAHASDEAHAGHAAAGHPVAAHDDDGQSPAGHDDGHACDCLGTCGTTAPVAAPRLAELRVAVRRVVAPAVAPSAPLAAAPAGEHVLPFAIGPPVRG